MTRRIDHSEFKHTYKNKYFKLKVIWEDGDVITYQVLKIRRYDVLSKKVKKILDKKECE